MFFFFKLSDKYENLSLKKKKQTRKSCRCNFRFLLSYYFSDLKENNKKKNGNKTNKISKNGENNKKKENELNNKNRQPEN